VDHILWKHFSKGALIATTLPWYLRYMIIYGQPPLEVLACGLKEPNETAKSAEKHLARDETWRHIRG
jgi:hypothetical protein